MSTRQLLTASQVGQMLDVDTSTIYRMAGDGRLPAVRVGRQWRFPADRVARTLDAGVPVTPNPVAPLPPPTSPGPSEVVAAIVDVAGAALGVMIVVTDMQGRPLAPVANPCPWFAEHGQESEVVAACVDEWEAMAGELDLAPRFRPSRHGFLCARTFVRSGTTLVAMVLAGGVAEDEGEPDDGFHHLDATARDHVLALLPKVAASLSPFVQGATS